MKRFYKFSLLVFILGITSCEDAYEIVQDSELSEQAAFRSIGDLQTGLNGAYAAYTPDAASNGDGDAYLFNDLFTDNIKKGISNNNQGFDEYNFIINTTTIGPSLIWTGRYSCINRINRVLRNFDRVVAGASAQDLARANNIKGQLIALRALCHFDLFQYFTMDYKNPGSPSVIIMNFVPDITQTFQRNNVADVLTFILSDLDAAEDLINPGFIDTFFLTQDAVSFLRARVLLFKDNPADYGTIETIAEDLLDTHSVISGETDYAAFWADDNLDFVTEDIFTLARNSNTNRIAGLFYANNTSATGQPFFEMSNGLYDLYSDSDIRKSVFVDATSNILTEPRTLFINKYPGSGEGDLVNHVKLFRASEMLLIKAEAEARQAKYIEAEASVQQLRIARYTGTGVPPITPTYNGNLNTALTDILLERRKELCYEAHRYLDLKRIGRELNLTMTRDPRDCGSFPGPCNLLTSDYRFTLPIPKVEVDANRTIQQNDNY